MADVASFGRRKTIYPQILHDQRLYCLPADDVLAYIPVTDDRLIIRQVAFPVTPAPATTPSETSVAAAAREWTDKSGKFKVVATLVATDGANVTLQKQDGTQIKLPLKRLSDADIEFVQKSQQAP